MACNLSNWGTKRKTQQKWPVFGCLSPNHHHLCFQGNKSVIWIGTDFKRGIATVFLDDLEPSATGLWACSLLIFSVSHTLHLASEYSGWKSPYSQGETNTFALFSLAAGAGRWNLWLYTITTWLQCHLLVTVPRAEEKKLGGRICKKTTATGFTLSVSEIWFFFFLRYNHSCICPHGWPA